MVQEDFLSNKLTLVINSIYIHFFIYIFDKPDVAGASQQQYKLTVRSWWKLKGRQKHTLAMKILPIKQVRDWFKSYGHVKWEIENGWILPKSEFTKCRPYYQEGFPMMFICLSQQGKGVLSKGLPCLVFVVQAYTTHVDRVGKETCYLLQKHFFLLELV